MPTAKQKTASFFIRVTILLLFLGCNHTPDARKQVVETDGSPLDSLREASIDSIRADGLISVQELKSILDKNIPITLIEVSKSPKYKSGHLPNAISVWRPDYEAKSDFTYTGMRATKGEMEYFLSSNGVLPSDRIIIYDTKGSCDALRLAWILRLYGHDNVQVINGGKVAWKKAGYDLTQEKPNLPEPTSYQFVGQTDEAELVSLEEMKKAINNPNIIILDTRESDEFLGKPYIAKGKLNAWKKGAFTYGCIPSSVHLNWSESVHLDGDHRFKCLKDLKYNFAKAGITPDKEILVYCQSGVRSTHTTYVLKEILGYPNVRNYDGSWIEWSYNYVKNGSVPIEQHTSEKEHQVLYAQLKKKMEDINPSK